MISQRRAITSEQRAKLAKALEVANLAEQKAKEMAELAATFQEKYRKKQPE
ncbi:hypothetical protein [Synechococcus sp. PCC 7336]|uniref:hypothetical protein n=1 Tax=Synechococcus sp. PCC 7336 TaxID=195250 RepID=UPI000349DF24|nr:hypothetical protein [Synechococcus sp. PCC 7336]